MAMDKLHVICMRMLLKRVIQCQRELGMHETHVSMEAFTSICNSLGMTIDLDEVRHQCGFQVSRRTCHLQIIDELIAE